MSFFKRLFESRKGEDLEQEAPETTTPEFIELRNSILGLGNPEYPFNSNEYKYAASSRMPCADFTGFIIDRLKANDKESICLLMMEIIRANPGIGTGPEWICDKIERTIKIPFKEYLQFDDAQAYYELIALWIISAKEGGDPGFWIAAPRGTPALFAHALACYSTTWQQLTKQLVPRANKFIKSLKDSESPEPTVWDDYPLFSTDKLFVIPPHVNNAAFQLRKLSIGARLHLLNTVKRGGGQLNKTAEYRIKKVGLDVTSSSDEILNSRLVTLAKDPKFLQDNLLKKELIAECEQSKINYRKSWNKSKLMAVLFSENPERVYELISQRKIVSVVPIYSSELLAILDYGNRMIDSFKVLSFAH